MQKVASERDARAKEKVEAQKAVEELKQQVSAKAAELETERKEKAAGAERVKALEGELAGVKGERDAQAKEKEEAREEAELTLLQLHQVQEKLESVFIADQAKQKQLEELKQQVSAGAERMKALEAEMTGVKDERDTRAKEKEEAQNEAELTLLQLHQVQEELEHYFHQSRTQDDLLRQHQAQAIEFKAVISKFVNRPS